MKFTKDLIHHNIPYSCEQCCFKLSCQKKIPCSIFYPDNMDKFLEGAVTYLKESIPLSKDAILKRHATVSLSSYGAKSDTTTLDGYYVRMINDTLSQIRKGKTAYIFNINQIKEILRFERNIQIKVNECGYEIRKVI